MIEFRPAALVILAVFTAAGTSSAQTGRPDPATLIAAQHEAMKRLSFMDGVWKGPASHISPSGERQVVTQTERVGPLLDGAIKVVEGRGHGTGGEVRFNAFGVVSFDPAKRTYNLRSYAQGNVGDFVLTPTENGYTWEIPAGPMTIRYITTVKDGEWHEVGDRILTGKEPVRFFEMTLKRVGDTSWPAAGAVGLE